MESKALLIHPYTSSRPVSHLANHLEEYREWSRRLNRHGNYIVGTAQEAIQYTASGSTIDWMASRGVMAFVMESRTPCHEGRWCPPEYAEQVMDITRTDGRTGAALVELVAERAPPLPARISRNDVWWRRDWSPLGRSSVLVVAAASVAVGFALLKARQPHRKGHIPFMPKRIKAHHVSAR
jgi:hypothetical protein